MHQDMETELELNHVELGAFQEYTAKMIVYNSSPPFLPYSQ